MGRFTQFVGADHIRQLVFAPGTTMRRVLFDPADGRCVERSVAAYKPDAAMRAQVRAADVTSRAPGQVTPASECQLDHVQEWLLAGPDTPDAPATGGVTGGVTGELNLQTLDVPYHVVKTLKLWDAVMDELRNVTWTTLFGRIYTTRVHDYRQYLSSIGVPLASTGRYAPDDLLDQRTMASHLVYAALTHRDRRGRLEAGSDDPASDDVLLDDDIRAALWVRYSRANGTKVAGSHPRTPTPEDIIAQPAEFILEREHWTDAFTGPGGHARRHRGSARDHTPAPF